MKKLFIILLMILVSGICFSQDIIPVDTAYHNLPTYSFKYYTADSSLWIFKGSKYQTTKLVSNKRLNFLIDSLAAASDSNYVHNQSGETLTQHPGKFWLSDTIKTSGKIIGEDVRITDQKHGNATYSSVGDWFNLVQSSSRLTGMMLSAHSPADGTLDISAGTGIIKTTNAVNADTKFFDYPGGTVSLVDEKLNWLYMDYDGGNMTVKSTIDRTTIHDYDHFPLGRCYRQGTATNDITSSGMNSFNFSRRVHNMLVKRFGFAWASGSTISESDTRKIDVTAGTWYIGNTEISTAAHNTNTGGYSFDLYYYNPSTAAWVLSTGTQLGNSQYNNTSTGTGLVSMSGTKWMNYWVYLCPAGDLYILYGQAQYISLAEAEATQSPALVPDYISANTRLIARITQKNGETNFANVSNALISPINASAVNNHDNLGGILGHGSIHASVSERDSIISAEQHADTVRNKGHATIFDLLSKRSLNDHDSLSTLQERKYQSLTDTLTWGLGLSQTGHVTKIDTSSASILSRQRAVNTYEPKIAAGTNLQYWRGDKSWQTLPTSYTLNNNEWSKVYDYAGNLSNFWMLSKDNILTPAFTLGVQSLYMVPDAGKVNIADMPNIRSASGDTLQYNFRIGNVSMLKMRGVANGSGGLSDTTILIPKLRLTDKPHNGYYLQMVDALGTIKAVPMNTGWQGTWNAATNTPTLANGTGTAGYWYRCLTAGTVNFGAGNITFAVGDEAHYNGSIWQNAGGSNTYNLQYMTKTVTGGSKIDSVTMKLNASNQIVADTVNYIATKKNVSDHTGLTTTAHGLGASAFHADSYFKLSSDSTANSGYASQFDLLSYKLKNDSTNAKTGFTTLYQNSLKMNHNDSTALSGYYTNYKASLGYTLPNNTWVLGYNYAGNISNLWKLSQDNILTPAYTLGIKELFFVRNSGINSIANLPVDTYATNGEEHGYKMMINNITGLKLAGKWNSSTSQVDSVKLTVPLLEVSTGAAANKIMMSEDSRGKSKWSDTKYLFSLVANRILYASATNEMGQLPAGSAGQIMQSNGASAPYWTTPTYPNSAGAGHVLFGDGTNIVLSTPHFPNVSATARKIIVSDGTNWEASTELWPVATAANNILRSNGTDWISQTVGLGLSASGSLAVDTASTAILSRDRASHEYQVKLVSGVNLKTVGGIALPGSGDIGIIGSTYGGTGSGFTKFLGATTSEKTYTLPNASSTILTDNAAVTVAQGGTGLSTITANSYLKGNGTGNLVPRTYSEVKIDLSLNNVENTALSTGNAGTASKWLTKRRLFGRYIDGSANMDSVITITYLDTTTVLQKTTAASMYQPKGSYLSAISVKTSTGNKVYYPLFTNTSTGNLDSTIVKTDKLTFNPSTGVLAATNTPNLTVQPLSGTTVNWNVTNGVNAKLTLSGNTTITLSNLVAGANGNIKVVTHASSSYTITISGYTNDVSPAISVVGFPDQLLSSGSGSKKDIYSWWYDGTTLNWNGTLNYQ